MDDRPSSALVRVGDGEREQAIARLRDAVVDGRITLEEFSDRVGDAQRARTAGDLDALLRDIPTLRPDAVAGQPVVYRAILSEVNRRGPLVLERHTTLRAVLGTITFDLRDATISAPEVELDVSSTLSTVTVLVPAGAEVRLEGGGVLSTQTLETAPGARVAGAPVIRVRGRGVLGTLTVRGV